MDPIFQQCEQSLQAMKANSQSLDSSNTPAPQSQSTLQENFQLLESSILELSKQCLKSLSECSDEVVNISSTITSLEAEIQLIKDSKAEKVLPQAKAPTQGIICSTLLVESQAPTPVLLPTTEFNIALGCLNEIGRKVDEIDKGNELVRKVPPDTDEPQPWTREADFFVTSQPKGNSSFNEIYKSSQLKM